MFTHKEYITEIYNEGSFTTAAKKLFVSQPALSATVKKLEEKIGANIFDRGTNPVKLTEIGKAYIESAEKINLIEKNFINKVSDISMLGQGSILVGGTNFVCSCILPEIIKTFSNAYNGITINLTESFSEDLKYQAINESLEIIIDYDFDANLFKTYPLKSENIFLCANKNIECVRKLQEYSVPIENINESNLEGYEPLDISLLENAEFLLLKKGNNMYKYAMGVFGEYNFTPKVKLCLDQMKTSYELARHGLGLVFVADTLLRESNVQDMVFFKLPEKYSTRTAKIAHKKNAYVSNCVEKFIQVATECQL